jgi:hypothetical protein
VALLLQDRWWEGAFTFFLLPSEIAFICSTVYNNLVTMKNDFFYVEEFSTDAVY